MENAAKNNQKLDRLWLLLIMLTGGALSVFLADSLFELSVFFSGILCVALIAIGRREGYLVGLYNSVAYSILAYDNGLYGEVYLNLLFYVPTGVIGYFLWLRHSGAGNVVVMRQAIWPSRAWIGLCCGLCTFAFGGVLGLNPNQNTPFIDASTTVLSVTATFLMMLRYKEQWALYILLNVLSIVMWVLRVIDGSEAGGLMALMWSLFLLNAVFGLWRWHAGAAQADPATVINGRATCGAA